MNDLSTVKPLCLTLQKRRIAFFQGRVYENYQGLKRKVFRLFDRITLHCSQEALFVSQSLMNEFAMEIPAVTRKGTVLGSGSANGVSVETFSPAAVSADHLATLRSDLGIEPEDFVVTIVGRINPDKGISEVAQVIRRVGIQDKRKRRIRFLFIGRVEGAEAQGQLDRLIRDGSAIHVDFTPDIAVYMALADVHLFLSHREGFGNVAIEAAAIGDEKIAVVDGTLFTVNPLRSTARPVAFLSSTNPNPQVGTACNIYGNSCMDIDLLLRDFENTPRTDDILVMAQKGAYAGCMASPFIQSIPALVCLEPDGGLRLARARTSESLLAALN